MLVCVRDESARESRSGREIVCVCVRVAELVCMGVCV